MKMKMLASAVLAATVSTASFAGAPINYIANDALIELEVAGTYASGVFDDGAAEIAAYDPLLRRLYITNAKSNTLDVVSIRNIYKPRLIKTINLPGDGVNSVAFSKGIVAVAVEVVDKTDLDSDGEADDDSRQLDGKVVFYNRRGRKLSEVTVGALPDMVTFTPDGSKLLVANEGEPNDDYDFDPEGSVSIIDLSDGVRKLTQDDVSTADFHGFDEEDIAPTRIFGPGASVAEDLEPEYIAVDPDGKTAYVVLQENNAVAVVDIHDAEVEGIVPLGTKSFDGASAIDASNDDDGINIRPWPVVGMYQPDAIATYQVDGDTYLVTANEGDARDYDGFSEEARVKDGSVVATDENADFLVDSSAYPNFDELKPSSELGRLNITTATGDIDGDGDIDQLHAYGARSFSIWNSAGELVYDSGSEFERRLASIIPEYFNSTNDDNDSFDNRSDDKGPEPEGLTVGTVDGVPYAFIGLERVGGVMVYDISNPTLPKFVQYINNRNFTVEAELAKGVSNPKALDLAPEGVLFIDGKKAPFSAGGHSLLVVTNEVSGTTTVYKVRN